MLQETAASSPAKEQKGSKWWFYAPKESNRGWVVVPDSAAAVIPPRAALAARHDGSGVAAIKGLLREGSLLSGADAVDAIGQQAGCVAFWLLSPL
jgi:hypothetical protein